MPVTSRRLDVRLTNAFVFARAQHVEACPDTGPACRAATPPAPYRHDVRLFIDDTIVDLAYGLTPWATVESRIGVRTIVERPRYTELDDTPKAVDDIHHRRETLFGPTDPWLVLRTGARRGSFLVAARLGVSLPLGSTVEDPNRLAAAGLPHEHFQLGTGTFMPLFGASFGYVTPHFEASASAIGTASLYENGKGYRPGSRLFAGARATFPLFANGALRPFGAVDLAHDERELWHGEEAAEGTSLRTDVLAGGGVAWTFAAPWQVEAGFRVRIAQLSGAPTLDYPALFQISVATSFDAASGAAPPSSVTSSRPFTARARGPLR